MILNIHINGLVDKNLLKNKKTEDILLQLRICLHCIVSIHSIHDANHHIKSLKFFVQFIYYDIED